MSGSCQNSGAASMMMWYWLSGVYMVDTCRWPNAS